jgi:hypothetical protein
LKKIERESKLKDGCNCNTPDLVDRKNKITKILVNVKYPTENEFNGAVSAFANSKLKIEEIESLAKSLTVGYANDNDNVNRPRAGVF